MQTYLVGGAVRDSLLGLAQGEKDWVVVGADADQMRRAGYKPVGKDFPVFLHPDTHEEYALARTERKTAAGYHGFLFHAHPSVTLEQDLARRDLTINAIAQDDHGRLIDPCGGRADIEGRVLRHVSGAFVEDPVRILRTARFAARFYGLGFRVAEDTRRLMRRMTTAGEVSALVPERVWAETARALGEDKPSVYFEVLRECGALQVLFPELERLWGVPQTAKWHPEIDTGVHVMMVVDMAAALTDDVAVRFAALTHDLGKGETPADILPAHHGHELRSVALVRRLCERCRVPNQYRDLALAVAEYHGHFGRIGQMRAATILKTLSAIDAFRRPRRFEQFLLACEADSRGRTGHENTTPPQTAQWRACYEAACLPDMAVLVAGRKGEAAKAVIAQARVAAIKAAKRAFAPDANPA